MKLRNFANKLLLIIAMFLVLCSNFTLGGVPAHLPLVTAATESELTPLTKTYAFDHLNYNKATGNQSLYEALGIKAYNNYLMELSATQKLNDVVVAVVDSGLDATCPVFADRVLSDLAMDFSRGIPAVATNDWDIDDNGHGTHVAGIIADGTLSNVKILPIKIFYGTSNESTNYYYSFLNAVRYLYSLKTGEPVSLVNSAGIESKTYDVYFNTERVKIDNLVAVNMSLGTEGFTQADAESKYKKLKAVYQNMIDYYLLQQKILPIVAAGNRGTNDYGHDTKGELLPYYSIPGVCDGVLAVSAYDNTAAQYALAEFSYYNDNVSMAAPGAEIWSACSHQLSKQAKYGDSDGIYTTYIVNGSSVIKKDIGQNFYFKSSGTSMATPFVTIGYALLMSDSSKTQMADFGLTSWNPDDATQSDHQYVNMAHKALLSAADGIYTTEYNTKFGYGILQLSGFVPAPGTTVITPLRSIDYKPLSNATKDQASEPAVVVWDEERPVDWFAVCVVLAAIVISIWLVKIFREYCAKVLTRGKVKDDEQ